MKIGVKIGISAGVAVGIGGGIAWLVRMVKKKKKREHTEEPTKGAKIVPGISDKPDVNELARKLYPQESIKPPEDISCPSPETSTQSERINNWRKIISVQDYQKYIDYSCAELTYYQDGVLCGTDGKPMGSGDIEKMIGLDFADYFGKDPSEPDAVYILNEKLHTYFAITMTEKKYNQGGRASV